MFAHLSSTIHAEGYVPPSETVRPISGYNLVGTDYFETLKIAIVRGRPITKEDQESSLRVAVINEFMARQLWPKDDPIGKKFSFDGSDGRWLEVVGISKQGKYDNIFEDPSLYFFAPIGQNYKSLRSIHVRTNGNPEAHSVAVQREAHAMDPHLLVYDVATLEHVFHYGGSGLFLLRMAATFAGAFGLLGLMLAIVGIYGAVSYNSAERSHEIGIRMALGAQIRDVLIMVIRQGLRTVFIGLAIGLALGVFLAVAMSRVLFSISSIDPITFGFVPLVLAVTASLACYLPARNASRLNPMETLRH